jgi:ATP-binding cassette, subfamily B, bacterial MsbA
MATLLRMLRYLRPYWRRCIANGVCIAVYALLSGVSVLSVSPFIRILFETRPAPAAVAPAPAGGGAMLQLPESVRGVQGQLRAWVEGVLLAGDRSQALVRFCLLVFCLFVLKNVFDYLQTYLTAALEQRALHDVRRDLYMHISDLPLGTFVRQRAGSFIAPLVNDVALMRASLVGGAASLLRNTLMIAIALTIIIAASWKLALVAMLVLPPNALLIARLGRRLRRSSTRAQERMADMTSVVQETVLGARVVKAFGMHAFEQGRFAQFNWDYFKTSLRARRLAALASPVSEILAVGGMVAILWYGGSLVLRGELRADKLFLFLTAMIWLTEPIKALIGVNNAVQEGIAAGERVFALIDQPAEPPRDAGATATFTRELRFEAVAFGYDPERLVLRDVNLVVRPGQIVALVGPSGAGKSTFVDLIPRFYEIQSGRITMDGVDLRSLSLTSLRRLMGIVTQEVILFNDTVRANIAYGMPGVPEDRVVAAAQAANAHDFISRLAHGYDTMIGERGVALSGGERQRLSIARAILRDPQILIFDEATSSLDTESEQLIQEAIDRLMHRRTAFVIAHRLSTIQHADTILVIDDGRIVERGTHHELLAAAGTYAKLHAYQFR